jgi:hypothetical protein
MALFAGLVIWTCRTPLEQRRGWRLSAEFAIILLGMLLFSERTWKHHCVTLLLPFAVLMYGVAISRPGPRRGFVIGTLVAATLLMLATSTGYQGDDLVNFSWGKLAQVYGAYVWAYILLVVALAVLLRGQVRTDDRSLIPGFADPEVAACPHPSWQPSRS